MRKIKNIKNKIGRKLFLLSWISFLMGFQMALCLYILSSFIQRAGNVENVGIFYFLGYAGGLFILLNLHHLFRIYGKSKVVLLLFGLKITALLGLALFGENYYGVVFAVLSLTMGSLIWPAFDILVEHFSKDKITGSIRGAYLTVINSGFIFAPIIAAWVVENFGFRWVFLLAGLLMAWAMMIIWEDFSNIVAVDKKTIKISAIFAKMEKRKNLRRIYWVSLLLDIFYSVMVVYTPIYLLNKGFSFTEIGTILMIALIPFVILQYPLGVLADKKYGEKEFLIAGLLIMAIFTGAMSFLDSEKLFPWVVVLFGTRIGAATIEVMRDAYFYKKIDAQDVDLIDFFRTTRSLSYIISSAIFGFLLMFFPVKFFFFILALILLSGMGPLWKLEDTL